jgi:GNAT superfamily N-acetyltransferase
MNILIANETDTDALTQVEIESKKQSIPECIEDFEIDYDSRAYRWKTYFAAQSPQSSKPERIVLKAVEKGKIVGYIAGHLTTRYEMDAEIQSFYILKPYQRTGIGTALLGRFIDWLASKGSKSLCVGIASNNKYKAFYLKHGGLTLTNIGFFGLMLPK